MLLSFVAEMFAYLVLLNYNIYCLPAYLYVACLVFYKCMCIYILKNFWFFWANSVILSAIK